MQGQLQQLFHLHDAGVDQSFIDTLPIFQYKTIIGVKDPFDCAVCLCEFEGDDKLRLLPKCSHAFHVDCIDTWLLTHSTCPLCRRSLLVDNYSPNNTNSRGATVFILESSSESSREIASDRVEPGSNSNLSSLRENEMSPSVDEKLQKSEEKVVTVKLGKFKCIENEAREGEATSSGDKSNKGNLSSRRRCFSMGSYEYVMDEQTSLRVRIKPPNKKPMVKKPPQRRLAMSECDCYSRRDGFKGILDSSRFSCAQAESTRSSIGATGSIQKKDSFSVSKIWMVPKKEQNVLISDDYKRRAVSFRLPLHRPGPVGGMSPVKLLGLENKSICSEIDWDLEVGSCNNGSSFAPSIAEEAAAPSFARRTLHWVIGRQNKS
jgi:Ring finger domain